MKTRPQRTKDGGQGTGNRGQGTEFLLPRCHCLSWLILLVAAGCQQPVAGQPAAAQGAIAAGAADGLQAGGALEKVTAGKPVRKTLKLFTMQPARLQAIDETPLHSKLAGYVKQVHVDLGDVVEAGQVLITLDVPELEVELSQKQALVDQAQAETRQSEAALAGAEAAVTTAKAQIRQAEAGIARAAADVVRWQSEFARLEQLAIGGSINKQLVDETKQKLAAADAMQSEAESAIASAQAAVVQSQAGVEKAKADIEAAKSRQRVAGANFQHALTMLAYAEIKAPYAGVITRRAVDPGYFVLPAGAEAAPLLRVARTDTIRVFAAIPELEAGQVDIGDPAKVQVQSLRNVEIAGAVSRTAWSLDESSRALEAVIDLENPDGKLRPGMYATAKILLAERPDALVLPSTAVVRKDNAAYCFLVNDGKAVQRPLELGIKVGDEWEILGGLADNDVVCLTKAAALKDGQSIDLAKPDAK